MHEQDLDYYKNFPAPVFESAMANHWARVNSTIAHYGPMIYYLIRAFTCKNVLEIGSAFGYTGYFMANAVKDVQTRYKTKVGKYYGLDIVNTTQLQDLMDNASLPADVRKCETLTELTPETFKGITFNLILQDGCHDTEHVLHELDILYPQLAGEGKGYWLFHDCYGPAENGFRELEKLIVAGKYNFEYVRLFGVYGLAILRKMDGYDSEKIYWK